MWSLPTRNRPNNLKRFAEAYVNTHASCKIFVRLDEDDEMLKDYLKLELPETFIVKIGERQGLKAGMEEMFHAYPNEDWYGLGADDLVPHTIQWDKKLAEEAGLNKIAHPNDMGKWKKRHLPTHPVCGGNLVREIGWFGNPATRHYFVDNIWQYIGESLNCIVYREDILVEHVHWGVGKVELDSLYEETNEYLEKDRQLYDEWINNNGELLIARLKDKFYCET